MSEENKDIKEISKQLVEVAGKKGCITYKEIIDILEKHQLDAGQVEKIYEILETANIEIIEDVEEPDFEELEDIEEENIKLEDIDTMDVPDSVNVDDPVRLYLKEIGKIPLLSAEQVLS